MMNEQEYRAVKWLPQSLLEVAEIVWFVDNNIRTSTFFRTIQTKAIHHCHNFSKSIELYLILFRWKREMRKFFVPVIIIFQVLGELLILHDNYYYFKMEMKYYSLRLLHSMKTIIS